MNEMNQHGPGISTRSRTVSYPDWEHTDRVTWTTGGAVVHITSTYDGLPPKQMHFVPLEDIPEEVRYHDLHLCPIGYNHTAMDLVIFAMQKFDTNDKGV